MMTMNTVRCQPLYSLAPSIYVNVVVVIVLMLLVAFLVFVFWFLEKQHAMLVMWKRILVLG